jgi:hypothetical protein
MAQMHDIADLSRTRDAATRLATRANRHFVLTQELA